MESEHYHSLQRAPVPQDEYQDARSIAKTPAVDYATPTTLSTAVKGAAPKPNTTRPAANPPVAPKPAVKQRTPGKSPYENIRSVRGIEFPANENEYYNSVGVGDVRGDETTFTRNSLYEA